MLNFSKYLFIDCIFRPPLGCPWKGVPRGGNSYFISLPAPLAVKDVHVLPRVAHTNGLVGLDGTTSRPPFQADPETPSSLKGNVPSAMPSNLWRGVLIVQYL